MNADLIIKIAGIGIIVAVAYQLLARSGRDEQAMLVSLAGIVIVLLMIMGQVSDLFSTVQRVFGLS